LLFILIDRPMGHSLISASLRWKAHRGQYSNQGRPKTRYFGQDLYTECLIYLPSPAMQWTATQLVGSAVKRDRSTSNQSTTTLSGGGVPSSNGKSYTETSTMTQ